MPRGDRSTATRDSILQSAGRVFARRGQYGATVREIAVDAGLTVPAVYYHFAGMDELYAAVIRDGRARLRGMLATAMATAGDAESRLRAIAGTYVRFGREDPLRLRVLGAHLFGPHDPDRPDHDAADAQAWIEGTLAPVVAEATGRGAAQAGVFVRLFAALMNGMLIEQARSPDALVLEEAIGDQAVALFLHGAAPDRSAG
jgi:AcrR family transcriptional regulator